jgi:hypothetical protein
VKASLYGETKLNNWIDDKQWADQYFPAIEQVIRKVANKIINFKIAPEQEDISQATDYLITVETGTIACRIRKPNCNFRDFTVRSWRQSNAKTELTKIKEGFGKWYLYAWTKDKNSFSDWILLDLDLLRKSPLLNNERKQTFNPDKSTAFISFSLPELYLWNIIIERMA